MRWPRRMYKAVLLAVNAYQRAAVAAEIDRLNDLARDATFKRDCEVVRGVRLTKQRQKIEAM